MHFQRVVCVSLKRRESRFERFSSLLPGDWPLGEVEHFPAVDGKLCPSPGWWTSGNPAWGCYKSHLNILEDCLNRKIDSCLFLEDDAICCEGFGEKYQTFADELPSDWEMIYLGGQHLSGKRNPPIKISEQVYIPFNVNRTHAFAIRGQAMMKEVYKHLNAATEWNRHNHIDHHLGRLHQRRTRKIYCPKDWLVGQNDGQSDISWKKLAARFFPSARSYPPIGQDFVVVMGLHRSGSSCVAMMLHKLGIHMGNRLTGYERRHGGGGEAEGLAHICEAAMPFPAKETKIWNGKLLGNLLRWIRDRSWEAKQNGTIAGAKYPHLCAWAKQIEMMLGPKLKIIHINRPLEESIESLIKREPKVSAVRIRSLQEFLWKSKRQYLQESDNQILNLEYRDVLDDPKSAVSQIVDFLKISPTVQQVEGSIAHPNQSFNSVRLPFAGRDGLVNA